MNNQIICEFVVPLISNLILLGLGLYYVAKDNKNTTKYAQELAMETAAWNKAYDEKYRPKQHLDQILNNCWASKSQE